MSNFSNEDTKEEIQEELLHISPLLNEMISYIDDRIPNSMELE